MRAISLHQPWASLVALGLKKYETRSWRPNWSNERIAIHAAKRWTHDQVLFLNGLFQEYPEMVEYGKTALRLHGELVPLGGIVATAYLARCLPTTTLIDKISPLERAVGDWSSGRWAWELRDIEIVSPVCVCRGHQVFFEWSGV